MARTFPASKSVPTKAIVNIFTSPHVGTKAARINPRAKDLRRESFHKPLKARRWHALSRNVPNPLFVNTFTNDKMSGLNL